MRSRTASGSVANASMTAGSKCVPTPCWMMSRACGGRGGLAVRAVRRQRVERVGDGEDPRRDRDRVAGQPVGIAGAVPALVVMADDVARRAEELDVAHDLPAGHGVLLHDQPLGGRQRAGLEEDRVGHGDLAGVVQDEAELDLRMVGEPHPVGLGELQPVGGDALGVTARVGVARLDRAGQRAHREHVGAPQLLGAGALLLERLAQVGGVALELALLDLRLAPALAQLCVERRDPFAQLIFRADPHRHHLPRSVGRSPSAVRNALTASGSPNTGIPTPPAAVCPSPSVVNTMTERL